MVILMLLPFIVGGNRQSQTQPVFEHIGNWTSYAQKCQFWFAHFLQRDGRPFLLPFNFSHEK